MGSQMFENVKGANAQVNLKINFYLKKIGYIFNLYFDNVFKCEEFVTLSTSESSIWKYIFIYLQIEQ